MDPTHPNPAPSIYQTQNGARTSPSRGPSSEERKSPPNGVYAPTPGSLSTPSRSQNNSPARQVLSEGRRASKMTRESLESPSRQMILEYSRMYMDEAHQVKLRLEQEDAERRRAHREALEQAAREYERVRQGAERARQIFIMEQEAEQKRSEEAEILALEEARRRNKEQEERLQRQKQMLEMQRREEERQSEERKQREIQEAAEARVRAEAEAKAKVEREVQEQVSREKAEAERKAKEQAEAAKPAAAAPVAAVRPPATTSTSTLQANASPSGLPIVSTVSEREATHKAYLEIHKNLKELRKFVVTESKKDPKLKTGLGDMRREITKTVGTITTENAKNIQRANHILTILRNSLSYSSPPVPAAKYLPPSHLPANPPEPPVLPSLLLYFVSILSKALVRQFITEASISPAAADPIAFLAATIFSDPSIQPFGTSLLPILLAKFHRHAPILFGIWGPESTRHGRARLGWARDGDAFVPAQVHAESLAGLAAGFAALALRDFSRSKKQNPLPNRLYWAALARLVSARPEEAGESHFIAVKALVGAARFAERVVKFWGEAGRALLRRAVREWPEECRGRGPARGTGWAALLVVPETWQKELRLVV